MQIIFPQSSLQAIVSFFSKVISDVIVSTQARKTKPDERKRIVGNAGLT